MLVEETLVGPAVLLELDAVHAAIGRFFGAIDRTTSPRPAAETRMAFTLGVAEIAANIVHHAYPPPLAIGEFKLRLRLYPDRLDALLIDRGVPFVEPETAADSGSGDDPERGLGLALARRTLDRVVYTRDPAGVNHWWLVKRL